MQSSCRQLAQPDSLNVACCSVFVREAEVCTWALSVMVTHPAAPLAAAVFDLRRRLLGLVGSNLHCWPALPLLQEKRKRDEGKASRGGSYVEEEKRRAREFGIVSGFD